MKLIGEMVCRGFVVKSLDDSAERLAEFGLTQYEAKVYLATLKSGPSSASQISKLAGIRREEVYRTLPKLEESGLVERVLGRPVRFQAIPLRDAISLLLKRKEEETLTELQELVGKKNELISDIESEVTVAEKEDEDQLLLIPKKESVALRIESLMESAQNNVDIIDSPQNVARLLLDFERVIKDALDRNVSFRILTEYPSEEVLRRVLENGLPEGEVRLRYIDDIPSRYIHVDETSVLLSTSPKGDFTEGQALLSRDVNLISIIRRDFEEQFNRAADWFTYISRPEEDTLRALKRLKPRDHAIFFYDTLELKHKVLFEYIKSVLDRGEAIGYIYSEENESDIINTLRETGVNVDASRNSSALMLIQYQKVYLNDGMFNAQNVLDCWKQLHSDARSAGFERFQVITEMAYFTTKDLIEGLLTFERSLHHTIETPIVSVCAYNASLLGQMGNPINLFYELAKVHGTLLYAEDAELTDFKAIEK